MREMCFVLPSLFFQSELQEVGKFADRVLCLLLGLEAVAFGDHLFNYLALIEPAPVAFAG
jgi:hypothetical protein